MNYEDDELERMRARREQRRSREHGAQRSGTGTGRKSGSTEPFKSSYTGPRNGSDSGMKERRVTGNRRRSSVKKKRIMIIAAEVMLLLVIVVGAAGWYVYQRTFGSLQKIDFDVSEVENINLNDQQLENMKGYMTIACFGVDSRSVGGKQSVGKGNNADVNLICNVNLETGEIKLVSVFRDTYLNITDKNSYNKINAAYASGGPNQAVKALNKNLGLNIKQYATFNWKAVADAINILGGVDIELSTNELSWINAYITETVKETGIGSVQLTKTGLVHMDGVQAVAYGRLRLGDTDYARTERQRIVMQKAFDKAKKADWATLNNIIQTITPQLSTNVTPSDLIPLARNITKYHIGETAGFPSARGEGVVGKYGDCVIPQTLESNVRELHKFLFNVEDYEIPSNVKEYSKHISDATGMYKEGTYIGHVPVNQGINARSYINGQQKKESKKAEAEAKAKAEAAAATATSEESTEESSTEESTMDGSGDRGTDEYGDDEWEEWETDEWIGGPGAPGPGDTVRPSATEPGNNRPGNSRPGDKATEADEETTATGPGMVAPTAANDKNNNTGPTGVSKPASSETEAVPARPGSTTPTAAAPGNQEAAAGPAGPGA